jgi:methylglyoxal synthase
MMRTSVPDGSCCLAISAAEKCMGSAAAWIRSAWAPLLMACSYRLLAAEAVLARAGLWQGTAGHEIAAEPLHPFFGPADTQILQRVLAGEIAGLIAFPSAVAPRIARDRQLVLLDVAGRHNVPVALGPTAAADLIEQLAARAHHRLPVPEARRDVRD